MTTFDLETILQEEAPVFIKNLLEKLKQADLKIVDQLLLDHICYRVESANQYKQLHSQFSKIAELLVEDSINGRLISTFKLSDPIVFDDRRVYLIELPMPKNGSPYALGFEHAEFVVGPDTDLAELASRYTNIKWDMSALSKDINPDIRVELDSTYERKMSAKFHHRSLEDVIAYEKTLKN